MFKKGKTPPKSQMFSNCTFRQIAHRKPCSDVCFPVPMRDMMVEKSYGHARRQEEQGDVGWFWEGETFREA